MRKFVIGAREFTESDDAARNFCSVVTLNFRRAPPRDFFLFDALMVSRHD
jgi:hypothetical protein